MKIIEKLKKYLKAEMKELDKIYIEEEKKEDQDMYYLISLETAFNQTEKLLKKVEELEDEGE